MSDGPFAALGVGDDLEFHASKEPKSRRPRVDGVKYVPYLLVMKFELLVAWLFSSSLAFGQFIPQPMGYNPDANSDGFIGVDDVLETLVLFGNAFENGDSLVVTSWSFPDDYPTPLTLEEELSGDPVTVFIPEATDLLYIDQTVDKKVEFYLPEGEGFHVLQVFFSCDGFNNWPVDFLVEYGADYRLLTGGHQYIYCDRPRTFTFIRGYDGRWYD